MKKIFFILFSYVIICFLLACGKADQTQPNTIEIINGIKYSENDDFIRIFKLKPIPILGNNKKWRAI